MKKIFTSLLKLVVLTSSMFILSMVVLTSCNTKEEQPPKDPNATIYEDLGNGIIRVKDLGEGTGNMTWTSDVMYLLDGLVFVNEGQTLTIEAGTIIKGKPGQETDASALIVARGGKIMANGTETSPIIFTAEADQLNSNIGMNQRGLWGGVIILGKAKLNSNPGETSIEGIPTTEPRGLYGGNDDNDNSGIFKYVSIRHGGTDIGEGNEINGLTLGGVGSDTEINHIEVLANKDDGIEFFGGMPRVKYILCVYCGDDCFDYDEGFRGYGQFWLGIQDEKGGAGDRLGEHDGGTDPETAQPYAIPQIYNATYIGRGSTAGKRVITFRDNAGGHYYNSIFSNQAKGVDVEILIGDQHSFKQMQNGNLSVENCIFSNIANGTVEGIFKLSYTGDSVDLSGNKVYGSDGATQLGTYKLTQKVSINQPKFQAKFDSWNNSILNGLVSASNPVPASASGGDAPNDSWFTPVTYKGAFEPGNANHWAKGWTLFFQ